MDLSTQSYNLQMNFLHCIRFFYPSNFQMKAVLALVQFLELIFCISCMDLWMKSIYRHVDEILCI